MDTTYLRYFTHKPQISVIVPIYNTKSDYVVKCIDSIINQSLQDIEIILVDDGSTNGISQKCIEYYNKDQRVNVILQENLGVSTARNNGVSFSSGKWITFVDSDDWIDEKMLEILLERGESYKSDIVICNALKEINGRTSPIKIFPINIEVMDVLQKKELMLKTIISKHSTFSYNSEIVSAGATWAKLYRRDFWVSNQLEYDSSLSRSQDSILNINAFELASRISFDNLPLYHYRFNEFSAVHKYNKSALASYELAIEKFQEFVTKNHKEQVFEEAVRIRKILYFLHSISLNEFHKNNEQKLKEKVFSIKKNRDSNLFSGMFDEVKYSNFHFQHKIFLYLIMNKHYYLAYYLYRLFDSVKRLRGYIK